jgi:hypothetical protein
MYAGVVNKPYTLGVIILSVVAPMGAGKTMYLLSAPFRYGNGYLASYPDLN